MQKHNVNKLKSEFSNNLSLEKGIAMVPMKLKGFGYPFCELTNKNSIVCLIFMLINKIVELLLVYMRKMYQTLLFSSIEITCLKKVGRRWMISMREKCSKKGGKKK